MLLFFVKFFKYLLGVCEYVYVWTSTIKNERSSSSSTSWVVWKPTLD